MDGRTDGWTDGAILICHPKFPRGIKLKCHQLQFLFGALRVNIVWYLITEEEITLLAFPFTIDHFMDLHFP